MVLTVGRDGSVNEQLLRVAEVHVQALHGENVLHREIEQAIGAVTGAAGELT